MSYFTPHSHSYPRHLTLQYTKFYKYIQNYATRQLTLTHYTLITLHIYTTNLKHTRVPKILIATSRIFHIMTYAPSTLFMNG